MESCADLKLYAGRYGKKSILPPEMEGASEGGSNISQVSADGYDRILLLIQIRKFLLEM